MQPDRLWTNAHLMTMHGNGLGIITDGVIIASAGRIAYAGPRGDAPATPHAEIINCDGRWITPGLIDCHTHLVFGGNRSAEWQARLAGATYAEMAAIGGIRATVAATRAATDEDLRNSALNRLDALIAEGVTTVEIKSGYGLDPQTEWRQLRIARALPAARDIRVRTTLLAAHAMPPGRTDADAYIDDIITTILPRAIAENLADAIDGFCETIAFSPAQIARLFTASAAAGLPVKLHADQLTDSGGAALAARFSALSADHLEFANADGIAAMARAGTAAVLLPGAYYALRETKRPPIEAMRAEGVTIAVATDCNPGSSPLVSPLLTMHMACTLFGLTIAESLRGMTCNAARALGLHAETGTLAPGLRADLAIWSISDPAELIYWLGHRPLWRREFSAS